jgi:hypothetical protein
MFIPPDHHTVLLYVYLTLLPYGFKRDNNFPPYLFPECSSISRLFQCYQAAFWLSIFKGGRAGGLEIKDPKHGSKEYTSKGSADDNCERPNTDYEFEAPVRP